MAWYFASDAHVGLNLDGVSTGAEARLISWLDHIKTDAEGIFLVGDIFDFWFEYKHVVPKAPVRLLAKLAELTDSGIPVHFFPGNHDMWVGDYFSRECGMIVHERDALLEIYGRKVYICHGDGLGKCSFSERVMQSIFRSKCARSIFSACVHPDTALRFGNGWSRSSRKHHIHPHFFKQEEEAIVRYAREFLKKEPVDVFVFGHLHLPTEYPLNRNTILYVLGDWIDKKSVYGRMDNDGFRLMDYEN